MVRENHQTGSEGIRLYYMLGGILTFDQSVFTHMQGMGNPTAVSTPIFLIDHPDGKVLFETGVHEDVVTDPIGPLGRTRRPRQELCAGTRLETGCQP